MSHDLTSRRILIIDHDDQFRFWARGVFRRQQVREAFSLANCDEAMALLSQYPIDLALVELVEGNIDNLMFIQALRNAGRSPCPGIPVVAILHSWESPVLERACGFGIHGLIRKPLSGEALAKTVADVLANPKLFAFGRPKPKSVAAGEAIPEIGEKSRPLAPPRPASAATMILPAAADGGRPSHAYGSEGKPAAMPTSVAAAPAGSTISAPTGGDASGFEVAGLPKGKTSSGALEVLETAPPPGGGIGFEALEAPPKAAKSRSVAADLPEEAAAAEAKRRAARRAEPVKPRKAEEAAAEVPGVSLEEVLATHELWVNSRGQDGKRAELKAADLSARDLANAQLTSADLRGADFSSSDLSEAQMHGADLREADMVGTVLSGANLAVSRLRRARMIGCSVDGANLKGADLAGADLSGSKFADADLTGAILLGAKLAGADLASAKGLSRSQLEGVTGDAKTRLPFGLSLPEN